MCYKQTLCRCLLKQSETLNKPLAFETPDSAVAAVKFRFSKRKSQKQRFHSHEMYFLSIQCLDFPSTSQTPMSGMLISARKSSASLLPFPETLRLSTWVLFLPQNEILHHPLAAGQQTASTHQIQISSLCQRIKLKNADFVVFFIRFGTPTPESLLCKFTFIADIVCLPYGKCLYFKAMKGFIQHVCTASTHGTFTWTGSWGGHGQPPTSSTRFQNEKKKTNKQTKHMITGDSKTMDA